VRWKLAVAMGVPSLALSGLVVFEVADLGANVAAVRHESELATATDGPTGLFIALQNERNWAVAELIGQSTVIPGEVAGYDETRAATDEALEGFEEDLTRGDDEVVAAYNPAMETLRDGLQPLRDRIDGYSEPRTLAAAEFTDEIFGSYRQLLAPFLEGTTKIVDMVDHAELGRGVRLIDSTLRLIEALADVTRSTIIYAVLSEGGVNTPQEATEVGAKRSQFVRYAARIEDETEGIYEPAVNAWLFDEWTPGVDRNLDQAASTGRLDMVAFFDVLNSASADNSYLGYRADVASIVRQEADRLNDAAASRRQTYLVVVAVVWVVAIVGLGAVGQTIIRALQSLVRQTTDVAERRLPAALQSVHNTPPGEDVVVPEVRPVEVRTHDEVADVADALNRVQKSALDLAVGQAVVRRNISDSLVNLGRRNQNLLKRQLAFITELEHREADPDNLANLFHLDHLATRMRRNAESLVVLADDSEARPGRPIGPARISDVIRAAVGEVEDYQRVAVPTVDPVRVVGHAIADLVHLLAELVDNAVRFSSPGERVEVRGAAHQAGYEIWIVDRGIGMSPAEVDQANRRLAGAEVFTVAPSKYLGHYVAGRLAARHGIQVQLHRTPVGGVTVTVHVPASALLPDEPPRMAGTGTAPTWSGSPGG
jgi:signal transduction histidine kinase